MWVKVRVCGCKQARGGQSYSSVRTHYNTKNEYVQGLSRAYRKQERMNGSLLTRAHTVVVETPRE